MVVVEINGGLGNQLFQYANGWAIAKKTQQELVLDLSMFKYGCGREFQLDKLRVEPYKTKIYYTRRVNNKLLRVLIKGTEEVVKWLRIWKFVKIHDMNTFKVLDTDIDKNVYVKGHWISHKYFEVYENDIRSLFQLKEKSNNLNRFIKEVTNRNSVALHVRRGDYEKLGWCLPQNYYYKAVLKLEDVISENKVFYIFSDDTEYAKKLFEQILQKKQVVYVKDQFELDDIEELFAISACKHQIIANSTFSWWGAWLNSNLEKVVIAPKAKGWDYNRIPAEWELIDY